MGSAYGLKHLSSAVSMWTECLTASGDVISRAQRGIQLVLKQAPMGLHRSLGSVDGARETRTPAQCRCLRPWAGSRTKSLVSIAGLGRRCFLLRLWLLTPWAHAVFWCDVAFCKIVLFLPASVLGPILLSRSLLFPTSRKTQVVSLLWSYSFSVSSLVYLSCRKPGCAICRGL